MKIFYKNMEMCFIVIFFVIYFPVARRFNNNIGSISYTVLIEMLYFFIIIIKVTYMIYLSKKDSKPSLCLGEYKDFRSLYRYTQAVRGAIL